MKRSGGRDREGFVRVGACGELGRGDFPGANWW